MHHWLSKEEQAQRNKRILELADKEVAQEDIGRRYGLTTYSVRSLIKRERRKLERT